jgi:hypothetical protein
MAGNKVKFHTLERLDLVDIDSMQNDRQDYDLLALGEFAGLGEGCLRPFQSTTIDNDANTISFSGFSFLSAYQSTPRKAYVQVYDDTASGNTPSDGLVSFETALATIQSYYNVNGSIPTAPIEANWETFSEVTHGSLYPFVWARAFEAEDAQDQRRFWSAAAAQEVTSVVNTRKTHKTEIVISYTRPSVGSEMDWARVGRLTGWTLTGSIVSLNTIRPYMLADSVCELNPAISSLDIEPYSAGYGGLAHTFALIKNKVDQFYRDGSEDGAEFFTEKGFHEQPRLSLQGLDAYARRTYEESLANSLSKRKESIKVTGMVRYKVGSTGGSDDIEIYSADIVNSGTDAEYLSAGSALDYVFDYEYIESTGSYTPGTPIEVDDFTAPAHRATTACAGVFTLPDSLLGKKVKSISVEPISIGRYQDPTLMFNQNGGLFNSPQGGFEPTAPQVARIIETIDELDSVEDVATIRQISYHDSSLATQTVTGVKVQLFQPGLFVPTTAGYGVAFKITLVLDIN